MRSVFNGAILVMALSANAAAQLFQHTYRPAPDVGSATESGQVTSSTGTGHLAGGLDVRGFDYGISVVRTDADGRFTTPNDFNRVYYLTHSSGLQLRFTAARVEEFSDGSGYGAIGTYMTQTGLFQPYQNQGIAYVRLDPSGNVMNVQGYSLGNNSGSRAFIMGLKESTTTPNTLYATGYLTPAQNESNTMWAMKIDQAGNLLWGKFYNFASGNELPTDLVENPYAAGQLIVVGDYSESANNFYKPFWMTINSNTGALSSIRIMSSFMGGPNEYIRSIKAVPGNGFILTGISEAKSWVVKLTNAGAYQWAGIYSSASNPGFLMYGHQAVGIINPQTGQQEYYVTGPYFNAATNGDAYVFRLDQNGNPINPSGLFLYDLGAEETGMAIDRTAGGFAMYAVAEANAPSSLSEIYIVQADLNGQSGCNERYEDLKRKLVEWGQVRTITATVTSFSTENISNLSQLDLTDNELCYTGTKPATTYIAALTNAEGFGLHPNPVAAGSSVMLTLDAAEAGKVQVAVYDITGRLCFAEEFAAGSGANQFALQLKPGMQAGIYTVRIKGGKLDKNVLLSVR